MDFLRFTTAAREKALEMRSIQFEKRKERDKSLVKLMAKIEPILDRFVNGELTEKEGRVMMRDLAPDSDLRREIGALWKQRRLAPFVAPVSPEESIRVKAEFAKVAADLERRGKHLDESIAARTAIATLSDAAVEGDEYAAGMLAEIASSTVLLLRAAERLQPALFEKIARGKSLWPILTTGEPGWEKHAANRIAELKLGEDFEVFHVRFRRAPGADANYPARLWAKAAVRAAEETMWRMRILSLIVHEFPSSDDFADFCVGEGWELVTPDNRKFWLRELKPLSKATLPEWKNVVRELIRDQIPDFHTHPEWENQRRTAEAKCRDTVGEVQNAILDDIVSALKTIAPDAKC